MLRRTRLSPGREWWCSPSSPDSDRGPRLTTRGVARTIVTGTSAGTLSPWRGSGSRHDAPPARRCTS
jgi:hypothetical protein